MTPDCLSMEDITPPPDYLLDKIITEFLRLKGREYVLVELGQSLSVLRILYFTTWKAIKSWRG